MSQTVPDTFPTSPNALFLNDVVLIPAYGDVARDAAAKFLYDRALNDGIPRHGRPYLVKQIPSSYGMQAIEHSASIRCAAHELHVTAPLVTLPPKSMHIHHPATIVD